MKNLGNFYRTEDGSPPKLGNGSILIAVAPAKIKSSKKETRTQRVFREFPQAN